MKDFQHDQELSEIAVFLKQKMEASGRTLKELAIGMGFKNSNFLSMIKNGDAKVPLDKVVTIARVLNIDPSYLMKLALKQVYPDESEVWEVFDDIVSPNEAQFISGLRAAYDDKVPVFTISQIEEAVKVLKRFQPSIKSHA